MLSQRDPASPSGLRAITGGTLVLAVAGSATLPLLDPRDRVQDSAVVAAVLAALLIFLHTRPARSVKSPNHVESIQLDEVLIVPILLLLGPWQSLAVMTIGSVAGSVSMRRSLTKTIFNLAQILLATVSAVWVVNVVGRSSDHPLLSDALAGMLGALVLTTVSAVFVRSVVSYATGLPLLPLLRAIADSAIPWAGAVTLGGVAAICYGAERWTSLLVLGLSLFVARAHTASVHEVIARRQAEKLQQAIASLRSRTDPDLVTADLLEAARDLLGASSADLVPEGTEDTVRSLSTPVANGMRLRVADERGRDLWDERDRSTLIALAGVAGDVLRTTEVLARLRTITNSQTEGVIALDLDARITFVNPAAVAMLQAKDAAELLGAFLRDKLTLRHLRRVIDFESMVTQRVSAHDADAVLGPPTGETVDIAYSITPLHAEDVHVGAVLVMRDVTERRAFQDELTRRALHDELTGLPNRRLLIERLDHALARSRTTGVQHGVLFLDLDRFKLVNDSYGHAVGDKLLVQVAARLVSGVSLSDSVTRMSGDEFVILIEDVPDIDAVHLLVRRGVLAVGLREVGVEADHLVSARPQPADDGAADEPGCPGDEHPHGRSKVSVTSSCQLRQRQAVGPVTASRALVRWPRRRSVFAANTARTVAWSTASDSVRPASRSVTSAMVA